MSAHPLERGSIILGVPSMQLLGVLVCAPLLDMVLAEKLDMEGGRTGRHVHFKPSAMIGGEA